MNGGRGAFDLKGGGLAETDRGRPDELARTVWREVCVDAEEMAEALGWYA